MLDILFAIKDEYFWESFEKSNREIKIKLDFLDINFC